MRTCTRTLVAVALCLTAGTAVAGKSKAKLFGKDFTQKSAVTFAVDPGVEHVYLVDRPLSCADAKKLDLDHGQPAGARMIELSNFPWKKGSGKFDGSGSTTQLVFHVNQANPDIPGSNERSENGFGTWKVTTADATTAHVTLTAHADDRSLADLDGDYTITRCTSDD